MRKSSAVVVLLIGHLITHHKSEGLNTISIVGTLRMSGKINLAEKGIFGSKVTRAFNYQSQEQGFEFSHHFVALYKHREKQIVRKMVAVVAQLIEYWTTDHKSEGLDLVTVWAF